MREKKSLDFSAARATTPSRLQVVALHWKAAVEGDAAHLTILTCRWYVAGPLRMDATFFHQPCVS